MIYFERSEAVGLERCELHQGQGSLRALPLVWGAVYAGNIQRGTMGVQCEEGEPGATKEPLVLEG